MSGGGRVWPLFTSGPLSGGGDGHGSRLAGGPRPISRVLPPGQPGRPLHLLHVLQGGTDQTCGHVLSHGVRGQDDEIMQLLS